MEELNGYEIPSNDKVEPQQKYSIINKDTEKNLSKKTLKEEVLQTGSLLHMVFTNNKVKKIRIYSDASVMFLCQFHLEKNPSFGVTDSAGFNNIGLCYCFGCSASFNIIDYVREYEQLTYHETVQLLCRIYMININNNRVDEDQPQVLKYRESLLGNEFYKLLLTLDERLTKRLEKYGNTKSISNSKEKIKQNLYTIERVKRGEYKNL